MCYEYEAHAKSHVRYEHVRYDYEHVRSAKHARYECTKKHVRATGTSLELRNMRVTSASLALRNTRVTRTSLALRNTRITSTSLVTSMGLLSR